MAEFPEMYQAFSELTSLSYYNVEHNKLSYKYRVYMSSLCHRLFMKLTNK
jgi:hypothetical protein